MPPVSPRSRLGGKAGLRRPWRRLDRDQCGTGGPRYPERRTAGSVRNGGISMTEDEGLQLRVLKELEYDPRVDAARVGVAAKGGVVTLTGEVASLAERAAAEEAARRVKGVRAIAQEVEVRLPHEKRRSDADIAGRALQILDWDVTVPPGRLAVEVAKGWVTLGGEVDWG